MLLETIKIGEDREFRLYHDEDPFDPRDVENLGEMVCFHPRYKLGDDTGRTVEELKEIVSDPEVIALPLYLLDHSGLRMRTRNFRDCDPGAWDSGQVGYIFCREDELEEGMSRKAALDRMQIEVDIYDAYIAGDCYGYNVVKLSTCPTCGSIEEEIEDSCWGFIGHDFSKNGMLDYLSAEVREVVERELL